MDSRFFREDNPYNMFMNTVGDLAMLSVAWAVCSLPIVTIGASTAAACEVARSMQEGRDNGIFRGFWKAFKRRFSTTMALTAISHAYGRWPHSTCGSFHGSPATPYPWCTASPWRCSRSSASHWHSCCR